MPIFAIRVRFKKAMVLTTVASVVQEFRSISPAQAYGVSRFLSLCCVRVADGSPLFSVVDHAAVLCDAYSLIPGFGRIGSESV